MTDQELNAKLSRIDALMGRVTPGSPEEAEYLALLRVAAGIEERARRRPTCAGGRSGHVGRGYTSREEAKAVAEAALRGWLLAMVEQVGGVMP